MIVLSLTFIGDFRDRSYQCFKDLAYGVMKLIAGSTDPFLLSVVRLGLHFDVVAMEAAEEEAITLHTELECMGKKVGIYVPAFEQEDTADDDVAAPPVGGLPVDIPTPAPEAKGSKNLPGDDFPDLPEALKELAHPRPKQKMKPSLERLIAGLPEMRKMLNPHQNKLLDEALALARGDAVPASNETEIAN